MSVPPLALVARALLQRLPRPRRPAGVTQYYRTGITARIAAARWQLDRHAASTRLLEVGCGRDLHTALVAAVLYGKPVLAFDVSRLAELDLINWTLEQLGSPQRLTSLGDLARLGIDYRVAPDCLGIEGFDGVVSTAVIEHVPPPALAALFAHLRRVLPPAGVVTAIVDYNDHWSYVSRVGPDHFYRVGERWWAVLNTPAMYQNRLRHHQVVALAAEHGLRVAEEIRHPLAAEPDPATLVPRFRDCPPDSLRTGSAWVHWVAGPT